MSERELQAILTDEQVVPAHRLRRNWLLYLGTLALAIVTVVLGETSTWYAALGWFGGIIGLFVTFLFVMRNAFPRATRTELRMTSRRAVLDGRSVTAEEIAEAKLVRQRRAGGDYVLELRLRDQTSIPLSMMHADALELLRVLEIGPGERRSTFRTVVPFGRRFIVTLGGIGLPWVVTMFASAASEQQGAPIFAIPMAAIISAIVAGFAGYLHGKIVIGADGFTTQWLFWKRFVSFADVELIVTPADTHVGLRTGKSIRLSLVDMPENEEQRGAEREALHRHLTGAYERWRQTKNASTTAPLLRRGGRTARAWLAGLEQIVRGESSGYRVATVNLESLVEIVRTPPEGADDPRIGAAAALVRVGVDEHRVLIRVAAEASAEPKTREALLALSSARTYQEVETILERAELS